ncbi:retrovirus-related Pol polyprotein from transposon 17.6 [Trichonephila clavipes]|nr:retrovirus-related Pol polyprotein from transposon 17.6 [Trichonephila clavipes]
MNLNPADRDKTTFVCPFGTYRFKRMPFGLKIAPATFQRLMDIFRRGLPVLAYLDDIIIMSSKFEQHLAGLEAVFKCLMDFKLRANREKCQFSGSRVKYLSLWITPQGIEVDHEKTSAILGILPPKNSLKQCLVSPPILKQADFSKPFLIRTDASSYSLGADLLQEDKEEHPVEFASFKSKAFRAIRHLCQPNVLKPWPLTSSDPYMRVKMVKDGSSSLRIVPPSGSNWWYYQFHNNYQFQLPNSTAKECALTLVEEVLLRYGIPRHLISYNGTQFVSAVMQQICYLLTIHQSLIPVYHPQANPVERKNRDLKPWLAILIQDKHDCWSEKLHFIRFALNTAKCEMTGQTSAFLDFSRELRSPSEVVNDIRVVIQNDNFVPEITPYHKLPNLTQKSPSSYEIASLDNPEEPLGVYHTSGLTPSTNDKAKPLIPLRKRGRPPKVPQTPGSSSGRRRNQRGRM